MTSSSSLRFDIADAPSEADVEVPADRARGVQREPVAGPSAMAAARRVRARGRIVAGLAGGQGPAHEFMRTNDSKDLSALSRNSRGHYLTAENGRWRL
jgi:hypothetical protein